jgi:predicted DNA-binding transcriptional regulator AlpA
MPSRCDVGVNVLLEHPERVAMLPLEAIAPLLAVVASRQAALSALQGSLASRLIGGAPQTSAVEEHLLTAEEVARTLGVTKRWVQRRAVRLPFARKLSEHAIRYSDAGLKRWMANRKLQVA